MPAVANKRVRQKLETRLKIVSATKSLIVVQGISGLKTLDVARKANIAHGSVFVHFPNKESLLIHTIEAFGSSLVKRIHDSVESQRGLRSVLESHLKILQKNEGFYAVLVEEARLLPKGARETLIAVQSAVSFHMAKSAEVEMENGSIKSMPAYLLFNTWIGLIHYYLANRDLFSPGKSVLKEKAEELISHFLFLINKI